MLIGLLGKNAILIIEVAEPVPQGRRQHYGSGHPRGNQPFASDSDDFFCFYQRFDPVGGSQWRWCFGQSFHRDGGGRRYADRYVRGDLLIPGLYVIFESLATYLKEKKQKANVRRI